MAEQTSTRENAEALAIGALGFMMRRYGLPLLPAIIGVILGPYAEEELRQALQISNGDVSGLFEPMSVVVYAIVALIVLFPVINRFRPRRAATGVLAEAAHEIEEAHQHTGLTNAVSVERHVGDRLGDTVGHEARRRQDSEEPSGL
jgi:putative tricarboxylic transport membrane protein